MTKSELCLKCMACCKMLSFEVHATGGALEFYKARGAIIRLILNSKEYMFVSIPHVCPKLTKSGCSIYENRPYACKVFDGSKFPTTKDVCLWNKEEK